MTVDHVGWAGERLRDRGRTWYPRSLYRFMSCETDYFRRNLKRLLIFNCLRLSSREEFNDIFDSQFIVDAGPNADLPQHFRYMETLVGAPISEARKAEIVADPEAHSVDVERNIESRSGKNLGIAAFSGTLGNPLMWAHYGDSYRGVAIKFRFGGDCIWPLVPVNYQEQVPVHTLGLSEFDPYLLAVKGNAWRYEDEYRIMLAQMARQLYVMPTKAVAAVVLGPRCAPQNRRYCISLAESRHRYGLSRVAIYQARKQRRSYRLAFDRIM